MMNYIVIELMDPEWPVIVSEDDGKPKIFDDWVKAKQEADTCQKGKIIEL